MIGILKASFLLVPLLVLLGLPIVPETQTASVKLRTAEVENTGTLLGENSPELDPPRKLRSPQMGETRQGS